MRKHFLYLVIVILVLAALPRSIEILSGNYLFGFDQGLFYEDVKKIVVDRKLTLIGSVTGGQGGLFQGPGWYYLLSLVFIIWSGDPYGGMVLMLSIGLLTVLLSIYFGSKMFGETTGLLIGFLVAISPAVVAQSRFIWPPFPVSFLTVFFLYFIFKVFQRNQAYLPLGAFVLGLMGHFELATSGTFFTQFLLFLPVLLLRKFVSLKYAFLSLASFALALSPLVAFNFRHDNIIVQGILNLSKSEAEHQIFSTYFKQIILNHLEVFKFNFLSVFPQNQLLWPVILGLMALGTFLYLKDNRLKPENKWFVAYLVTNPLALFGVFMFYLSPMWEWWILQLIILYIFAFGIMSTYLWN